MPSKQFTLDERTVITIYKRQSSRSLRLSITARGEVRVTIPAWTPYAAGLQFAKSKRAWIESQRRPQRILLDGDAVGKAHHLRLMPSSAATRVTSRLVGSEIYVKYPSSLQTADPQVQRSAEAACIRALRRQAEQLLPARLAELAARHTFEYRSVAIKQLKSRWGSCDQQTHIVLNLFLMQLPWECIDYVLIHELTHTKELNHGPQFWEIMRECVPRLSAVRKVMRGFQPVLHGARPQPMA